MLEYIRKVLPWLSAAFNFLLALSALVPEAVSGVGFRWRVAAVVVAILVSIAFAASLINANRRNVREASDERKKRSAFADAVLRLISEECVRSGDWRVSVLREQITASGEKELLRVHRLARLEGLSDGGLDPFPARRSVLRELDKLEIGQDGSEPVDERKNLPLWSVSKENWEGEQSKFVGDRAEGLRMKSSSYAWRRVRSTSPDDPTPYVLLVESVSADGVRREGLEHSYVDSLVNALVRALRKDSV